MPLFSKTRKDTTDDGQMELVEHLAELRNRIIRVGLYIAVAMVVTYNLFPFLYRLLFAPAYLVLAELKADHNIDARPVFSGIQDAFLLRLETALFAGIILSLPLILWEIWGFVRPALTSKERAPVRFLAPFATFLLMAGLGTGYGSLREAYRWMSQYIVDIQGATLLQNAKDYLILT
ncbi:MAG: twin-arginine translocase subunit TatC, partial [Armatimonadota bacterium]